MANLTEVTAAQQRKANVCNSQGPTQRFLEYFVVALFAMAAVCIAAWFSIFH